ncbi:restriction endonuclease subunit S [Flavobacteriales bacterium]|nr:restriction endonuclease subunit S [Flavobacteriales bacterium]
MMEIKSLKELIQKPITGEWGQEGSTVKILRTTNFTNEGRLDYSKVVFRDVEPKKIAVKRLNKGDIIIEKSGGSPTQPVGRVVYFDNEEEFLCNNFTAILRPDQELIYPKYLLYILFCNHKFGFTSAYQNKTTGIINLQLPKYIAGTKIPLPPLPQQKKIASILDAADAYRQKTKALIAKYDELTQSLFLDMFGDPVANNKKWKVDKLKSLSTKIGSGNTPKGGKKVYVDEGITFFRSMNVWKNNIVYEDIAFIDEETHSKMPKSSLKHKDILMTKTGRVNTENSSLGRAALYLGEDDMANVNGHVYLIRLKEGVLHEFVLHILTSKEYRDLIRRVCVGGIDKRQLNKDHIEDFPIIAPPQDMQDKFVNNLKTINHHKESLKESLAKAEDLFNSLLQKAFKGELS